MNHTIKNLIPTLRQFAQKIEFKSAIVGKIWVFPEDGSVVHDYEFTSDGKLYMTVNGNIQVGKWEILPTGRIVIDRVVDKIMLNFDFALDGIVVMKKTGNGEMPFLLYDKEIIPDGNVYDYIESLEKSSKTIGPEISHNSNALNEDESNIFYIVLVAVILFSIIFIYGKW